MINHWLYKNIFKVLSEELFVLYQGRSYESCDALLNDHHHLIQQLPSLDRAKKMGMYRINTKFEIKHDATHYWVESLKITVGKLK